MHEFDTDTLFRLVDLTGVLANGLLGGALARTKRFDPIGFIILAAASALGGGILRDVMLTVTPVALSDPLYLSSALVGAFVAFVLDLGGRRTRRVLLAADALALGCWSATGAAKALAAGLGPLQAIFLGVITAIGGGMLRDVLVGQVPAVFGGNPLYATLAVLGSAEMVVIERLGSYPLGMGVAIVTTGVLGVLARRRNWTLPPAANIKFGLPGFRPWRQRWWSADRKNSHHAS